MLFVPRLVKGGQGEVGLKGAIVMGVGQAFAILPGISRSGSTIAAGLLSGAKAERAAEFSFFDVYSCDCRRVCVDDEEAYG